MEDRIEQMIINWLKSDSENTTLLAHQINELFINALEGTYTLVEWPYSQEYMEEEWFREEAYLSDNSSYFIPTERI